MTITHHPVLSRREAVVGGAAFGLAACSPPPIAIAPPPPSSGIDPAGLNAAIDLGRSLDNLHSLIIARHGVIAAEQRFSGPDLGAPVNIKSASKSVLSALVGAAISRGVLESVDQPIAPLFEADLPRAPDPRLFQITIAHLLSMRAGLQRTSGPHYGAWVSSPNWVRYVLSRPFEAEPGGPMLYSTGSSHLLSAVLTKAAGQSTLALARTWLAEPLGIEIPAWPTDPQGVYFGGNDMRLSPMALLRFGELYRNGGRVDQTTVLPANWIAESWQARTRSSWSGHEYGYAWFTKHRGGHAVHFAWGYGGQMLFIVPALELTVVMMSDPSPRPRAESHVPVLHRMLDEIIIPAAQRGAPPAAQAS